MTGQPSVKVIEEEPGAFPRWIMGMCPSCGGVLVEASPSPHPSWPRCSCKKAA